MYRDYDELKVFARDAKRALEREREEMTERAVRLDAFYKMTDYMKEILAECEDLKEENEMLRAQLQEKEVQLSEQRKLTTGMAKKSSEDELIKAIRVFINNSKRKSIDKRTHIKDMIRDLADAVKLELPDDLRETLANLDDEQAEPKVVNVSGNYNDVHDNGEVKMNG